MKLLCTGDLHLGRRSSQLPKYLDSSAHSAASCWSRIVDLALAESVDLVLLSGDLVDQDNRFYEALGPLEAGLRRLAGVGISTFAVAGNHDHNVLPRLADGFDRDSFRLLGRGGVWERATIRRGDLILSLDGWSFPERYVRDSPIEEYDLPEPEAGATIGLLHADLDQPGSPYAPVSLAELRSHPIDFWLLGHIHAPQLHESSGLAPVLYPGSPQALHPGEAGGHGVWVVEIQPGNRFQTRQVPLSTIRYDQVQVDLTGAVDLDEVDARVVAALRAHLIGLADPASVLRHLSCRLRVTGRTELHHQLAPHLNANIHDLSLSVDGVAAFVERVQIETRPEYELTELVRGRDPVSVLARLLLALEDDDFGPVEAELLRAVERAATEVGRARAYLTFDIRPEGPVAARRALARQAMLLLDLLIQQKEAR